MVRDTDIGKRMVEEQLHEQLVEPFLTHSGRERADADLSAFPFVEGSPDFAISTTDGIIGFELAEVRDFEGAWDYFSEVSRIGLKKSESYHRRGLFRVDIILMLYSYGPPLSAIAEELADLDTHGELLETGFMEVWAADLNDAFYSVGHPFRTPDMFCFKAAGRCGFYRTGGADRKPYG